MENQSAKTISQAEIKRRQEAFEYAKASVFLEGFELSAEYEKETQKFINGEIDFETFFNRK